MYLNKADIICMPGVPVEMKTMFLDEVLPFLKEKYQLNEIIYKDLHFLSIPESDVDVFIRSLKIEDNVQCIINAGNAQVVVKLRGDNKEKVEENKEKDTKGETDD